MCGGYALAEPTEVLEDVFNVDLVGENLPGPSWNIRPTNQVPIVVDTVDASGDQRRLRLSDEHQRFAGEAA